MKKAKALQYAKWCENFMYNFDLFWDYFQLISFAYIISLIVVLPFLLFALRIHPLLIAVNWVIKALTMSGIYCFSTFEPLVYKLWDKLLVFADREPYANCE